MVLQDSRSEIGGHHQVSAVYIIYDGMIEEKKIVLAFRARMLLVYGIVDISVVAKCLSVKCCLNCNVMCLIPHKKCQSKSQICQEKKI